MRTGKIQGIEARVLNSYCNVTILVVEETDYSITRWIIRLMDGLKTHTRGGANYVSLSCTSGHHRKTCIDKAEEDNFDRLVILMFSFLKCIVVQHKV